MSKTKAQRAHVRVIDAFIGRVWNAILAENPDISTERLLHRVAGCFLLDDSDIAEAMRRNWCREGQRARDARRAATNNQPTTTDQP